MLISVWMHECIEACGSFSLVGHCVAFVIPVIAEAASAKIALVSSIRASMRAW